ncbi:hypothetical protein EON65_09535 [archaeon]|nr:MAG: hypothetical protein EON65_09535 [archaeon]
MITVSIALAIACRSHDCRLFSLLDVDCNSEICCQYAAAGCSRQRLLGGHAVLAMPCSFSQGQKRRS